MCVDRLNQWHGLYCYLLLVNSASPFLQAAACRRRNRRVQLLNRWPHHHRARQTILQRHDQPGSDALKNVAPTHKHHRHKLVRMQCCPDKLWKQMYSSLMSRRNKHNIGLGRFCTITKGSSRRASTSGLTPNGKKKEKHICNVNHAMIM